MDVKRLKRQRVGSYQLCERLGKGTFGAVYRATQSIRGEAPAQVAVKILDPEELPRDPLSEVRLALKFNHANLVRLLPLAGGGVAEVEDHDGERGKVVWFAMEIGDTSLEQRIYPSNDRNSGVALSADELLGLARDLAAALAYLHELGHFHRDVKPGNILRFAGTWKLGDFGVARASDGASSTQFAGTRIYLPQEAKDRERYPHAGWDVWGFGVTLVEAATGRHPIKALDHADWERALSGAAPFPLPNLPEPLRSAVAGALTVHLADQGASKGRWTSQQIAAALNPPRRPAKAFPDIRWSGTVPWNELEAIRSKASPLIVPSPAVPRNGSPKYAQAQGRTAHAADAKLESSPSGEIVQHAPEQREQASWPLNLLKLLTPDSREVARPRRRSPPPNTIRCWRGRSRICPRLPRHRRGGRSMNARARR